MKKMNEFYRHTNYQSILLFIEILSSLYFLASCKSVVTVKFSENKTKIEFSAEGGNAFEKTLSILDSSADEVFFDAEEIKQNFMDAGFTNVKAVVKDKANLLLEFSPSQENKDPLTQSGLLKFDEKNKPYFVFNRENFLQLYELIPFELKSYIDLFMAPSFTDENMTDEEYLELLASVFGQSLADEIKDAKIDFIFEENGKKSHRNFSLLTLLNIEGTIVF